MVVMNADPDQNVAFDLGLHCLLRPDYLVKGSLWLL